MADPPSPAPNLATLEALRNSLEHSLLRSPSVPVPPALAALVALALPPSRKLREIDGAELLRKNLEWAPGSPPRGLAALSTALGVLEKYGRNLLSPSPPRHWRAVRFGNPVFRSTVGAVQGGRAVLKLLGYTEESGEGLSFPPPPGGPDRARAARVTADVIILRREIDLLQANQHPNPQFFTDILLGGAQQPLESDAIPEVLPAGWSCPSCTLWNEAATVLCRACDRPRLARRPQPCPSPSPAWPCPRCTFLNRGHAPSCDVCGAARDHAPADDVTTLLATPTPGAIPVTSGSGSSTSGSGSAPSGAAAATSGSVPTTSGVGIVTSGSAVTTSGAGTVTSGSAPTTSGAGTVTSGSASATSGVGIGTSGCDSPGVAQATSGSEHITSGCGHAPSRDALRQRKMLEDGRRLVGLVRAAEAQGLPPEALGPSPLATPTSSHAPLAMPPAGPSPLATPPAGPAPSPEAQIRHFRRRLGQALQALLGAGPEPEGGVASPGLLSLAEAAWAWLEGEGQPEKARRVLIGRRKQQVHALLSLGFPPQASAEALRQHQGSPGGALRELQRERLRPFHLRHFRGAGPALDFRKEDQQALVRQVLATLPVASWGRASLVASLGRELGLGLLRDPSSEPLLGELVEAVGSCGDRAVLRRRLRCECAVCGWGLPRRLMQWLPGCSCPLCPECFRLHFTVGVRERGVAALGCPSCGRPDLRDDAQRLCYWSTLEPGLRRWLDPDTFGLVTRKLTELELLRDPQFLWCPHCSFGFIFEGERGPAQCPQCHQCCCPRCQLPWDPRHAALSCADFGAWLQSHNAPGPGPGLSAFLEESGVVCPQCSHWFSLARGGCLHFRCSRCQHEFCAGCGETFQRPASCPAPCPLRASLHAHHPRDCLFYLRDWEPPRLQQLLLTGNVPFETEPPPEAPPNPTGGCPVPEQKEFGAHFRDEPCGRETAPGQAGLCRAHYGEYLVSLINRHGLDPAPLYDLPELLAAAERHLAAGRTRRLPGESPAQQEVRLRRLLEEEAPLRPRPAGAGPRPICK